MLLLPLLTIAASSSILVLQDTGSWQDGLPVFRRHPDAARYERVLTTGFSGRLVRLYTIEQRAMHPGRLPQPAVLCLTQNQGGFPREGYVLDGDVRRDGRYVDLHAASALTGRYGAIDQIFPHELMHIILRDLAGEPAEGRASQVHAVGVTTDRVTAFDEGLAEHAQAMAIDAADAAPDTAVLARDAVGPREALAAMERYRRAMSARWSIAPRAILMFPFWFSGDEQVLRYHGVRPNLFAFEPYAAGSAPRRAHDVYLLDNVLPGDPSASRKPLARLLATEGVVSALFTRWMTDPDVLANAATTQDAARFGHQTDVVEPIDRVYLKLFAALATPARDVVSVVRAYERLFPDDRPAVERLVASVYGAAPLPDIAEIWLLNADAPNGTSVFDQFRAMPRAHAFDLNAASAGDLLGVSGVDPARARAILAGAPYDSIADLDRVQGIDASLRAEFARLANAAAHPPSGRDAESSLSFRAILIPYARYASGVFAVCAMLSAFVYRAVRRARWWRLALNGIATALVGLLAGWLIESGSGIVAWVAPTVLLGVPAAVIAGWRMRSAGAASQVFAAWALAACVPLLALCPIG